MISLSTHISAVICIFISKYLDKNVSIYKSIKILGVCSLISFNLVYFLSYYISFSNYKYFLFFFLNILLTTFASLFYYSNNALCSRFNSEDIEVNY